MSTGTAARISRSVVQSVLAREQSEGVGATVRRSIGTSALRHFTPFLMLDNFKVAPGAGFPDHPHRGQTTLTYVRISTPTKIRLVENRTMLASALFVSDLMVSPSNSQMLEGEFEHEDFVGHKGRIGPGDLQFMIAGAGIMHAEMPIHTAGGKDPLGLQLWIDLPKEFKMVEPSYQELKASEIPSAHPTPNILIKVICGSAQGNSNEGLISSPVRSLGGCWFLDILLEKKGEKVFQAIPAGWNAFIYTLEGNVLLGPVDAEKRDTIQSYYTSILSNEAGESGVHIEAFTDRARLVVVAGEPLDQEIHQHGPFVMDTREGIQQAFSDFQRGTNGFEKARGWKSEIGKAMT